MRNAAVGKQPTQSHFLFAHIFPRDSEETAHVVIVEKREGVVWVVVNEVLGGHFIEFRQPVFRVIQERDNAVKKRLKIQYSVQIAFEADGKIISRVKCLT